MIPANESWTAQEFAFVFFDRFIRYHGLPDKIVIDWGSLFVSKFWREVQRLLHVKPAPSMAWHPRTDGQTERANQKMETYLWHFLSDRQDDWVALLPLAELYFNSMVSASTGFSPFFSQYAFHPKSNMFNKGLDVLAADTLLDSLILVQDTLKDNLERAKEFQRKYFDQWTRKPPKYEAGAWVWLLRQNIPTTRPLGNLDFKRLGPFRVDLPMGNNVYRLILPKSMSCVHPVFHTSLLLPFIDPDSFPQRIGSRAPQGPFTLEQQFRDKSDVEAILGH